MPPGCVEACRGCRHRTLEPAESLRLKHERVIDALRGVCRADQVAPIRARKGSGGYRERITLHAEFRDGRWRIGTRGPLRAGSRHEREIVEIPDCPVHTPRANAILRELVRRLPPDPALGLAFVVVSGALATLVFKRREPPGFGWVDVPAFQRAGLESLSFHLNPSAGNRVISGVRIASIFGEQVASDGDGLLYGPRSFRQAVPALHGEALEEATRFLAPAKGGSVIDLYSGVGAGLREWTSLGARALGIELNSEAVALAARNAPLAETLRGKCSDRIPQIREWIARGGSASAYLNPPRAGTEPEVIEFLSEEPAIRRIAYLSCSPGSLSRDLRELTGTGFRVQRVIPFDFFPGTDHVETLALLDRVSR